MPLLPKDVEIFPEDIFSLPSDAQPWAVAHVRSRQEKTLARYLLESGIAFYLPLVENRRERAGRKLVSFIPLFPGYVFFRSTAAQRSIVWRSDIAANVVSRGFDQEHLTAELAQIRALQLAGATLIPQPEFAVGDSVRVESGPFAGYLGSVVRDRGRERLVVQISLIRRSVAVEFRTSVLKKHQTF